MSIHWVLMGDLEQPGESDAQLMRRVAGGDMSALTQLVHRHQDVVRRLAYRTTGRWDVADDIAQETFLRVYRAAGTYHPSAAFRTWLYRIVVNLCLDRARAARPVPLTEVVEPGTSPAADQALIQQERVRAIQSAIAALPERQRMAVLLHRFENFTHGQIADATGWSESAVESLLSRAYETLRQKLKSWVAV